MPDDDAEMIALLERRRERILTDLSEPPDWMNNKAIFHLVGCALYDAEWSLLQLLRSKRV